MARGREGTVGGTDGATFLSAIQRRSLSVRGDACPWNLPLFRDLDRLDFHAPVTFLVGENGSGKSTLLEELAAGMGAVAAGARAIERDESLSGARAFAEGFRFVRKRHARIKLFIRAEDVFGFTRRVAGDMHELTEIEEGFRRDLADGSVGQIRATGMVRGQRRALADRYGDDPDARSHGETFLNLLLGRLTPGGLYFLDEPETPLSPLRVLSLISLLKDRVDRDCQFIVATHSPLLMALPNAEILLFEDGKIRTAQYDEVEHVRVTRAFLDNPESFLRHL